MKFINTSDGAIEFELRGKRHRVPPGESCDIPANLEYALVNRGLPLARDRTELAEDTLEVPEDWRGDELPPAGSVARVWAARAVEATAVAGEERQRAAEFYQRAIAAEALVEQLQADILTAQRERDSALSLLEEAGAKTASPEPATASEPVSAPEPVPAPGDGGGRRARGR